MQNVVDWIDVMCTRKFSTYRNGCKRVGGLFSAQYSDYRWDFSTLMLLPEEAIEFVDCGIYSLAGHEKTFRVWKYPSKPRFMPSGQATSILQWLQNTDFPPMPPSLIQGHHRIVGWGIASTWTNACKPRRVNYVCTTLDRMWSFYCKLPCKWLESRHVVQVIAKCKEPKGHSPFSLFTLLPGICCIIG